MSSIFPALLVGIVLFGCDRNGDTADAPPTEAPSTRAQPRSANRHPPTDPAVTAQSASAFINEQPALLLARGMDDLKHQTGVHDRLFQISAASWALDQDTGVITFSAPDGVVATAKAQIVGTFNTLDNTWLWAWDNPSIVQPLRAQALLAKAYGAKHGLTDFTRAKFETTEARAWELTAMACRLTGCQGAYRGPADASRVFITFGEVSLQRR